MEKYPFIFDIKNIRFMFDDKKSLTFFLKDVKDFGLSTPAEMLVAYLINNQSFAIFIDKIYCPNRYRVYIKGDNIYYER